MSYLEQKYFSEIDLDDPFFDSLKADYKEFEKWYIKKAQANEKAIVLYQNKRLSAFLYMKIETEAVTDVEPNLPAKKRLKVGTLKVEAHGTKLGERFIKRIIDTAMALKIDEIYLTIFEKHSSLIGLLNQFGFEKYGYKDTQNGREIVLLKSFKNISDDTLKNYPLANINDGNSYLLAIYPEFHTRLFSDSILNNESVDILQDRSYTNSIHKIYLTKMNGIENLQYGDKLLIYRTRDKKGPAHYRSVATSVCIVEEVKNINEFENFDDFIRYCEPYSVFTYEELQNFYKTKKYPYIIKMTYNMAFRKRVTRGQLIEKIGFDSDIYWGFFDISNEQLFEICKLGGVDESLIIY